MGRDDSETLSVWAGGVAAGYLTCDTSGFTIRIVPVPVFVVIVPIGPNDRRTRA